MTVHPADHRHPRLGERAYMPHGLFCEASDCERVSCWGRWIESEYESVIWVCERCAGFDPSAPDPDPGQDGLFGVDDFEAMV